MEPMEPNQGEFKDLLTSALDEILDSKLAAIFDVKLVPIIKSLDFISNGFDELTRKVTKLEESNKTLENENRSLKNQTADLWKEVNQFKTAMDEQEQYSRRECLEIRGIPTAIGEDTDEIIKSVGSILDVDIDDSDISVSHRIGIPSSTRPETSATVTSRAATAAIIVKFTNRNIRDKLYKSRSKLKNFTTGDIGLGRHNDGKIFIQESLTPSRRQLFKKALEIRKELRFKFIWTYYVSIFLRKDESSQAVRITSLKELEKLQARSGAGQNRR